MKTVHKLVLKSYLGPMILTFFIVMFVLIMQFMWRYIDELVGKGLDMSVIGRIDVLGRHDADPDGTAAGHVVGRDYDAGKSR